MNKKEKQEIKKIIKNLEIKVNNYENKYYSKVNKNELYNNDFSNNLIILGITIILFFGIGTLYGIINPTQCNSGDCINSNLFYYLLVFPLFVGVIILIFGMLLKIFRIFKGEKAK